MSNRTMKYFAMILPTTLFAGAALAQQAVAAGYSEDELRRFAEANQRVVEIEERHKEEMKEAESHEETQALQREANKAMVAAVRDAGLSLQDYSSLVQAVANDDELAERIDRYQSR